MDIEKIKSPFPEKMDLIPGLGLVRKIGEVIRFVIYFPNDSTIFDEPANTGAAPLLDRELYDGHEQGKLF